RDYEPTHSSAEGTAAEHELGQAVAVHVANNGGGVAEPGAGGQRTRPAGEHAAVAFENVQMRIGLHDDLGHAVAVEVGERDRRRVVHGAEGRDGALERAVRREDVHAVAAAHAPCDHDVQPAIAVD